MPSLSLRTTKCPINYSQSWRNLAIATSEFFADKVYLFDSKMVQSFSESQHHAMVESSIAFVLCLVNKVDVP
jgi:hypothetical protein